MSFSPPWLRKIRRRERHRRTADDDDEHLREMFDAALYGDINRLKVALETLAQSREQINISMLHESDGLDVGWTPLHAAVYGGHFDVAALLIALGADVEACEGYLGGLCTPFHLAVESGNPAMVRFLLDSGANAGAHWYHHGREDYGIATFLAIGPGREPEAAIEVIDMLLDHGLDINEPSPGCRGNRLMYDALKSGSVKIVKYLMRRGALLPNDHSQNLGRAASSHRSSEALEFLVEEQGHRDIDNGLIAIFTAAGESCSRWPESVKVRSRMVRFLVSHLVRDLGPGGALKDVPNINTLFRVAVLNDNAVLARLLLEHGVGTPTGPLRDSNLVAACRKRAGPETIKVLLDAGEDVNCHTNPSYSDEVSPLLEACRTISDPDVIKLLLEAGADINCHCDGNNTLHYSLESPATIKLLLSAGVDPRARNHLGETPLFNQISSIGARHHFCEPPPIKDDFMDCIRLLAEACQRFAEMDAVDRHGRSALHLLARETGQKGTILKYPHRVETYVEAACILIERGARLDIRDDRGRTVEETFQQEAGYSLLDELRKTRVGPSSNSWVRLCPLPKKATGDPPMGATKLAAWFYE
ncbi:hypothetical protein RB595_007104 [Gaeumannomyces hyphopodioides]